MPSKSAESRVPTPNPDDSFEASLERLSAIVERLEGGELPLEESLRLFEEGVKLARSAQARLDSAEKRVEELLSLGADGMPVVRVLDNGDPP
ncbi:MAG: exodeoxyribonuclease VII small subunit [Polyangiaceae bacterium]